MTCHECDHCFLAFGVSHHKPFGMRLHQLSSFGSNPWRRFPVQSVVSYTYTADCTHLSISVIYYDTDNHNEQHTLAGETCKHPSQLSQSVAVVKAEQGVC